MSCTISNVVHSGGKFFSEVAFIKLKKKLQVIIIRPGRSRLLEFEKKIALVLFLNSQTKTFNIDVKLAVAAMK